MSLTDYIKKAESYDLTNDDILKITNNECNIMSYSNLYNIEDIEQAFNGKNNLVLLYEISEGVGHWVGLLKRPNNIIEFFDSYGLQVDEELNYTQNYYKDGEPHLTRLLKNSKYTYYCNKIRLQEEKRDDNTCGRHIAMRIKFSDMDLITYTKFIKNNQYGNPDFWVSAITLFI